MCGIGGVVVARAMPPAAEIEQRLWRIVAALRHRGPDDEGVWTDGRAGLAHTRLSIIDLSPAGHQPMASVDGMVWIAYNGEVYNFGEIRSELEALGYRFRGQSDTEVIVNGWHAWGPRVFARLRGMFALGLWDRRSRRLILARDRIGKKPLYWADTPSGFVFGSEIKALLTWPGLSSNARSGGDRPLPDAAIRPGAADRLCRDPQTAGGPLPGCRGPLRRQHRHVRAGALLAFAGPRRRAETEIGAGFAG